MCALEGRIRIASDAEVLALLHTEDGRWLFVDCWSLLAGDVARRLATVITDAVPPDVIAHFLLASVSRRGRRRSRAPKGAV